ncbi:unnamed protein product [Prorocentrum cordatum]|uniref:Uncharacterized protein n=1 Tax=Prorocentrum cordatum TaxID=2364126 RepID=A0ABN9UJ44_9DINO|nr:unnamed protein product [Polarella glacialis]
MGRRLLESHDRRGKKQSTGKRRRRREEQDGRKRMKPTSQTPRPRRARRQRSEEPNEDEGRRGEREDEEDVAGGERTRREGGDVHQRARPRRPHASEWPALHARGNWHRGGSHAAQAQRQARRSAQISLWQGI